MTTDKRRDRLRFRSWHRGTREIDLILGSFADLHLHAFSEAQINAYEALLQENDPDIYDWIIGLQPLPSAHDNDVMQLLQKHRVTDLKAQ